MLSITHRLTGVSVSQDFVMCWEIVSHYADLIRNISTISASASLGHLKLSGFVGNVLQTQSPITFKPPVSVIILNKFLIPATKIISNVNLVKPTPLQMEISLPVFATLASRTKMEHVFKLVLAQVELFLQAQVFVSAKIRDNLQS